MNIKIRCRRSLQMVLEIRSLMSRLCRGVTRWVKSTESRPEIGDTQCTHVCTNVQCVWKLLADFKVWLVSLLFVISPAMLLLTWVKSYVHRHLFKIYMLYLGFSGSYCEKHPSM